jgi:formate hydrogenlyase subunit 3/multisubunit Na+/H+ antiporter MnhD subunit
MTTAHEATYAAKQAGQSKEIGWAGRLGLVAMGVSYGLVAVLAIELALGRGGKATDRQGALQTLAHDSLGRLVVILLAVGFGGYAVWRFAEAFLDRGDEGTGPKGLAKRVGYLGRGLIYAGLCVTAVAILLGSSGSSSEKKETAWVLDWPAGRWIVGAVGAGFLAAAIWNVIRGLTRKFKKQLNTASMSAGEEKAATLAGVVGLLARGVVFGLIGVFLVRAAWQYEAKEAIGIDGALRKLAAQDSGDALLFVVSAGLLAFGIFCLFQARYRRV